MPSGFVLASEAQESANFKLNVLPFLTKSTDFAEKHPHFCRQGFAKFIKVFLRIKWDLYICC